MNYTALKQKLIGPHVTLVTPWKGVDQALDEAGLRSNARCRGRRCPDHRREQRPGLGHVDFGNFVPKLDIQLYQAATAGRWDEVRAIEKKRWALAECYHAFEERHGINAGMEMLYEATAMVGRVGGIGRPPLTPLTDRDRTELKAALKLCGGL